MSQKQKQKEKKRKERKKSSLCSNTVKETCVFSKVSDSCQHWPGFRSAVKLAQHHPSEVPTPQASTHRQSYVSAGLITGITQLPEMSFLPWGDSLK